MSDIKVITDRSDIVAIANAVRSKTGITNELTLGGIIGGIETGVNLPELTNPATAEHIEVGYEAIDANGDIITGTNVDIDSFIDGTVTEIYNSRVTSLKSFAFANRNVLTTVNLPNLTSIATYAFYYCRALSSIELDKITAIPKYAFQNCEALKLGEFPLVESVSDIAFKNAFSTIASNRDNTIRLPQCTSLGGNAFQLCLQLNYIEAPLVTSIGAFCFSECYSLRKINMPNLTSIPTNAFQWCQNITSEEFSCLTSIGASAFSNCTSLASLTLKSATVVTLENVNAFTNTSIANGTGYIYVPSELVDTYKTATNWTTYADQIVAIS